MPRTIYGLACETVWHDGASLLLSREPALRREDMAQLDEKMLKRVQVPGLLPLEFQEVDSNVTLRYSIPNARTLQHVLAAVKSDMRAVATLLYGIACILEDSKMYMLNEARYVLHESFVYIANGRLDDIKMVYVPLKQLNGKLPFRQDFARFVAKVFELAQIPRTDVQELLNYANENTFQLSEWKTMLLTHMDAPIVDKAIPPVQTTEACADTKLNAEPPVAPLHSKKKKRTHPHADGKLVLGFTLLLLAATWAAVCYLASEGALMAGIGVTLLTADGLYYKLKVKSRDAIEDATDDLLPQSDNVRAFGRQLQAPGPAQPYEAAGRAADPLPAVPSFASHTPPVNVYSALAQQTVLLRPQEETVLLTTNGREGFAGQARLEVTCLDRTDEIVLRQERFVIGRHAETSDFAVDAIGVSRMHAEIFRTGNGYGLKDLGSKNGTFLNGELLVPFQEYELKEGDRFTVVRAEFVYRAI